MNFNIDSSSKNVNMMLFDAINKDANRDTSKFAYNKKSYCKRDDTDDTFKEYDFQSKQLRKESKEHNERIKKQREKQKETRKILRQRIEIKKALMENSGVLWTSELTAEAQQILKHHSPEILKKYLEKKKKNEKAYSNQKGVLI